MEMRIDLAVVAGNSAEMEKHAQEKHEAQTKQECNCAFKGFCLLRMLQYPTKASDPPKDTKEDCKSPTKECSSVTAGRRWRGGLRSEGLADPGGEASGEAAGPLLVKQGQSDQLRATALVAPICDLLPSGRHRSPPDLAAAVQESLPSRILALSRIQSYRKRALPITYSDCPYANRD